MAHAYDYLKYSRVFTSPTGVEASEWQMMFLDLKQAREFINLVIDKYFDIALQYNNHENHADREGFLISKCLFNEVVIQVEECFYPKGKFYLNKEEICAGDVELENMKDFIKEYRDSFVAHRFSFLRRCEVTFTFDADFRGGSISHSAFSPAIPISKDSLKILLRLIDQSIAHVDEKLKHLALQLKNEAMEMGFDKLLALPHVPEHAPVMDVSMFRQSRAAFRKAMKLNH